MSGAIRPAPGPLVDGAAQPARTPPDPVDAAWFAAPVCRNCGDRLDGSYCSGCGQKAAKRFVWRDIVKESWDRLRLFELKSLKTLARLATGPGVVARNYVLGCRTRYTHPLVLLVALVAVLVLVLAANRYFDYGTADDELGRMAERVILFANWSFSLGIFAVLFGSWAAFGRRLGYNLVEHGVLAVYVQAVILAAILINMLPTLIWRDAAFVAGHREASQYYLYGIKLAIVGVAYRQFFVLELRRDWPRLLLACGLYAGSSWLLLRAYAAGILWLVSRTA